MDYFTQRSIELANEDGYLDRLAAIYPLTPGPTRQIAPDVWRDIETYFHSDNDIAFFRALLKLELFPVKDGYVPFLRMRPDAIEKNPQTVSRICQRVRGLGLEKIYEQSMQPKETNRQMGPLFKKWVQSGALGLRAVDKQTFMQSDENAVLLGSDAELSSYAKQYLKFCRKDGKGIDLLCRVNGKYVIGEAKFISDSGGHQSDQLEDALKIIDKKPKLKLKPKIITVAIIDGIAYIPNRGGKARKSKQAQKMYMRITGHRGPIVSALLLRDFLSQL